MAITMLSYRQVLFLAKEVFFKYIQGIFYCIFYCKQDGLNIHACICLCAGPELFVTLDVNIYVIHWWNQNYSFPLENGIICQEISNVFLNLGHLLQLTFLLWDSLMVLIMFKSHQKKISSSVVFVFFLLLQVLKEPWIHQELITPSPMGRLRNWTAPSLIST